MQHTSKIIRFEEHFDPAGSVTGVFVACRMTCDAAPTTTGPDGQAIPETRYYEHWFTPEQAAAYPAQTDRAAYVHRVVAEVSGPVCEAWLDEVAARPPEPRRLSAGEIEAELNGGEVIVTV